MLGADTFLLNPLNRNFVEGRASKPVSSTPFPGCMVLFMVPFLIAGVFTLGVALNGWYRVVGFMAAPRAAEASVVEKGIEPDDEGDDDPYLVYRYSADEAHGAGRYTDKAFVSWDTYKTYNPEDTLPVEYIAYSPGVSHLAGTSIGLGEAGFMTFFTLFWNAITVPMFVFMLVSRAKSRSLARRGQLVPGTLTCYKTSTDSDNDLWVKVGYSFHSPMGQLVRGEERSMHNELRAAPPPPVGTPVAILYVDDKTHTVL